MKPQASMRSGLTTITFRPATISDARLLLTWRNDPATKKASRTTSRIGLRRHLKWLRDRIESGNPPMIAFRDGVAVGTVRLDEGAGEIELSWTVAPEWRRRGIGERMVREAVALTPGPAVAFIKPDNEASIRIAHRAGFEQVDKRDGILTFRRYQR